MDPYTDYLKLFSADEMSALSKERVLRALELVKSVQCDWCSNLQILEEIKQLSIEIAEEDIVAGIECLDLLNRIGFLTLPALIGGASWPAGGGQPFEWFWYLRNTYFAGLCRIVLISDNKSQEGFKYASKKLIYELEVLETLYEWWGRDEVRSELRAMMQGIGANKEEVIALQADLHRLGWSDRLPRMRCR